MPAQKLELRAQPRTVLGKQVKRLRREGIVPANLFGHGPSRAIQAPARELEKLFLQGGRTGLLTIALDGQAEPALVKKYTRDPKTAQLLHVDFQAVSLTERVTATVPLRFTGEAPAVKEFDGVLTHPLTEVQVDALARDLPDALEVDLSSLTELHGQIKVADLQVPPGVAVQEAPEQIVATVQPPAVEEAPAEAVEAEAAATEAAGPEEAATSDADQEGRG